MVKIGVLSMAHGHALSYAAHLRRLPDAELVGIWDDDPERRADGARRFEAPAFDDLDSLLAHCDGGSIGTIPCSSSFVFQDRGGTVELVVSKGPAPIPVPDVKWISGAMAAEQLEAAGFTVAGIEGSPSGMVLATDPVAGELHQRGTEVRLFTRS